MRRLWAHHRRSQTPSQLPWGCPAKAVRKRTTVASAQ
jgi:hypothetical protein